MKKQFTSWGEFVKVVTSKRTYQEVIICPIQGDNENHLLEYNNGFTVKVKTSDILNIERYSAVV